MLLLNFYSLWLWFPSLCSLTYSLTSLTSPIPFFLFLSLYLFISNLFYPFTPFSINFYLPLILFSISSPFSLLLYLYFSNFGIDDLVPYSASSPCKRWIYVSACGGLKWCRVGPNARPAGVTPLISMRACCVSVYLLQRRRSRRQDEYFATEARIELRLHIVCSLTILPGFWKRFPGGWIFLIGESRFYIAKTYPLGLKEIP